MELSSFIVPKASPLNASKFFGTNIWTSITILQLQKDFSMAISSLVNSGIYQKIQKDITTSTAFRGHFDILWTREQLQANKPLTMDHALASFITLGLGLIPAILIFFLELFHHKKKNANQVVLSTVCVSDPIFITTGPKMATGVQNIGK